jgi:SP family sugar:H+ symporter-like MFS transporter
MGFLSLKKPENEVGAAWPSIMVGAFAAFAGILYGYDTGTISVSVTSSIHGLTDN